MKSDKATFHTFNQNKREVNDETQSNSSSTTCYIQYNMNFNLNRKLLIVTLSVLVYSVSLVQGNLPFGPAERIPPRENCTGDACVGQRAAVERMRNHRLATIRQTIFEKLGLENKPNVTKEIPKVVIQEGSTKGAGAFKSEI